MLQGLERACKFRIYRGFLVSVLPSIAPHCARGGVRMVSHGVSTVAGVLLPISHPFGTGFRAILSVPTSTILASRSLPRTFRGRPSLKGDYLVAVRRLAPPQHFWFQDVKHHLQIHRSQ